MEARQPLWRNVSENPQPLIFAVCIIVLAALIGTEIWAVARGLMYRPALTAKTNPAGGTVQAFSEPITAAELFGHAASQNNLPETSLQLTLRAVFAARDPRNASAVVETSDGRARVIKVGASVGGDALLQEVHENRVVLSRNGALETLFFPTPQQSTEFAIAQNVPAAGDNNEITSAPDTTPPPGASPDEIKRAAILQRLEELRARSSR